MNPEKPFAHAPQGPVTNKNYLILNGMERNPVIEREINPDKQIPAGWAAPDATTRLSLSDFLDKNLDFNPVFESKLRNGAPRKNKATSASNRGDDLDAILSSYIDDYDINDYMDNKSTDSTKDAPKEMLALPPASNDRLYDQENYDTDKPKNILFSDDEEGEDDSEKIKIVPVSDGDFEKENSHITEDKLQAPATVEVEQKKKRIKKIGEKAVAAAIVLASLVAAVGILNRDDSNSTPETTPTEETVPTTESILANQSETTEQPEQVTEVVTEETVIAERTNEVLNNMTDEQKAAFSGLNPADIQTSGDVMPWTNAGGWAPIEANLVNYNQVYGTNFSVDYNDKGQFKLPDSRIINPAELEKYNILMQQAAEVSN